MLDLSRAWEPDSDRLNTDDFISGPRTVTVTRTEWPSNEKARVHLAEYPGRPLVPSKGVGKILLALWGDDGEQWTGRRLTLYADPRVSFNKDKTGGVRVSHASNIDKPRTFRVLESRSKRLDYTIQPLPDDAPTTEPHPDWHALIDQAEGDVDTLRNIYQHAQQLGASEGVLNAIKTAATNKEN